MRAVMSVEERDVLMVADGWLIDRELDDGRRMWTRGGHGIWDKHAEVYIGRTPCSECGDHFEVRDRNGTKDLCFLCDYWLQQLAEPKGAFVTEDWVHLRDALPKPGHGGFWHQGEVPERFRERFAPRRDATDQERLRQIGEQR